MKRLSLHEWRPMLPWPVCPLAGHAKFGQNVVVGSMLVLRVALGNVPRGVWLDPHFYCKRTIPRFSVELPRVSHQKETLDIIPLVWCTSPVHNYRMIYG